MKKVKPALAAVTRLVLSPELKPFEVKAVRAAGAALLAYLGVKYGTQA